MYFKSKSTMFNIWWGHASRSWAGFSQNDVVGGAATVFYLKIYTISEHPHVIYNALQLYGWNPFIKGVAPSKRMGLLGLFPYWVFRIRPMCFGGAGASMKNFDHKVAKHCKLHGANVLCCKLQGAAPSAPSSPWNRDPAGHSGGSWWAGFLGDGADGATSVFYTVIYTI